MFNRNSLVMTSLAFPLAFVASPAQAVVEYSEPMEYPDPIEYIEVDLGVLTAGQQKDVSTPDGHAAWFYGGTIVRADGNADGGGTGLGAFTGGLSAYSKVVFTYTLNSPIEDYTARLYAEASNWTTEQDDISGEITWVDFFAPKRVDLSSNTFEAQGKDFLLLATSWFPDSQVGIIELSNLSPVTAWFRTYLVTNLDAEALRRDYAGSMHYEVMATPLPAALPLFGLGLAGLAGYRRIKNKNKTA